MLVRSNNLFQQRKQSLYKREITRILYEFSQEEKLPFFSLSYCVLSGGEESLKVYLTFSSNECKEEILGLINKKYSPLIKKKLAKSKMFSYIPNIFFLKDKEWEEAKVIEAIIKKLNNKNG